MYTGPFRIRRRSPNNPEPDYGETLSPEWFQNQNYFTTPLGIFWNGPGDITRWMACPGKRTPPAAGPVTKASMIR